MNIVEKIIEAINDWLSGPIWWFLENSFGTNQLESIENMLHLVSNSSSLIDTAYYWKLINLLFATVRPLGYALITTYFLVAIVSLLSKEALTLEGFVKLVIQLIIVITIAGNAELLMNGIFSVGEVSLNKVSGVIDSATNGTSTSEGLLENIFDAITVNDDGNPSYGTGLLVAALIWLFHQIIVIGIDVAAFSRLLDIGWRAALMPIGIADCFEGGVNSAGVKYIKSFASSVFSGVLMLIIAAIGFTMSAGALSAAGNLMGLIEAIAIQFATVGACIGAPAKAKELFA